MEYTNPELFIRNVIGIDDPELLNVLSAQAFFRHYQKKETVLNFGAASSYVHIVVSGVFRLYAMKSTGEDMTESFIFRPGSLITCRAEFERPLHSNMALQSLTPSDVLCIPIDAIRQLLDTSIAINHIFLNHLRHKMNQHLDDKVIRSHTSEERFLWFKEKFPELSNGQVQDQYIASYLNMTPATYSRLKSRFSSELNK